MHRAGRDDGRIGGGPMNIQECQRHARFILCRPHEPFPDLQLMRLLYPTEADRLIDSSETMGALGPIDPNKLMESADAATDVEHVIQKPANEAQACPLPKVRKGRLPADHGAKYMPTRREIVAACAEIRRAGPGSRHRGESWRLFD
jgi:hypothetical protein